MKFLNKSEKLFFIISTILFISSIIFFILYKMFNFNISLSSHPCFLCKYVHIYCPGCGGTRAFKSLLNFSFIDSFLYNPIVIYSAFGFLYYYIKTLLFIIKRGKSNPFTFSFTFLYIGLAIILINFIAKNILAIYFNIDLLGDMSIYWNK